MAWARHTPLLAMELEAGCAARAPSVGFGADLPSAP
jgi:hypothetical protein